MARVVARLPAAKRSQFKDPLGQIFTDVDSLLAAAGEPLVAIGDVVLAHLGRAGRTPTVSVLDGRTERGPIEDWMVEARPPAAVERTVTNPAGTLTADLVAAIEAGLDDETPWRIIVDGEEDLAVLPAMLLAPSGATVVYGQPGEGMVAVQIDSETRSAGRQRLGLLEHDREFWASIG